MKPKQQLFVALAFLLPAFPCLAETWFWTSATCHTADNAKTVVFVSVTKTEVAGDDGNRKARDDFANFVEEEYSQDACGVDQIVEQDKVAYGEFTSREAAQAALDTFVSNHEKDGLTTSYVRITNFDDE